MTDIRYMNDLSELQYATDRLAARLDARLAKGGLGAASKEFIESCRRNIDARGPGQSVFLSFLLRGRQPTKPVASLQGARRRLRSRLRLRAFY